MRRTVSKEECARPATTSGLRLQRWRSDLLRFAEPRPGERIVDIGCGTGTFAIALKQAAPESIVLAVDPDPAVLEIATPMVCLCFLETPIDFDALDGKPVKVLFTPLSPNVRVHLHLLSRISFALRDPKFKALLGSEGRRDEILDAARALEPDVPPA